MSIVSPNSIDTNIELPVMEHFYTIQGEGVHSGRASYFIRLAGCDVGCTWCDVKESWEVDEHPLMKISELVKVVSESNCDRVVITGGEPLIYDLKHLCNALSDLSVKLHIETSGAYPLSGTWDWICVSPKRFKLPLNECLQAANELKTVIAHQNDLRFAEKYATLVNENCELVLQPEWSVETEILPAMITFVKRNPHYRILLQSHKYLQVP